MSFLKFNGGRKEQISYVFISTGCTLPNKYLYFIILLNVSQFHPNLRSFKLIMGVPDWAK